VLEWFQANAGRDFDSRPFEVGLPIKVTSRQRGIWKPAGTAYAVSVVQTHKGIYEDQDPVVDDDGVSWTYFYHQEGKSTEDLKDPQRLYSNAGLFAAWKDRVPVGVVIPAETGKGYHVLGLALVDGYSAGFFTLVGPVSVGALGAVGVAEPERPISAAFVELPTVDFDPDAQEDTRLKVIAAVSRRQGGPRFRRALLSAYEGRCAMTRYDAEPALEAAHIIPYRGPQTNHPANGLLLRADMHDLFDLGLIAVDESMQMLLADNLAGTMYEQYAGARVWVPEEPKLRPSPEALAKHRALSVVA
jgi:hypothetical protein